MVKNLVVMWETWVGKISGEGKATTPVFLPGESPWTEEPGRLQSMGVAKSQTRLSNFHIHKSFYSFVAHSFLLMNNIPLPGYIIVHFSIHLV